MVIGLFIPCYIEAVFQEVGIAAVRPRCGLPARPFIAILLTGGEAHDCPVAERLIRRVKPAKRMLGDKAYDSAELREELHERGTKPVIPNRSNRKRPFRFSKRLDVVPKFVSPSDPAAQWTGAQKGPAFFAYSDNYLIDVKFGVIVDVEASRAIRQAEVGAAKTVIERTEECFGLKPERLAADTAYGAASMLN
jgi:hypothetical protein